MTRFDLEMDGEMEASDDGRWVRYHDHMDALAEQDKAYQQLMEKAVRFATVLGKSDRVQRWEDLEECWVAALDFLNSQEAQAFLKEREGK